MSDVIQILIDDLKAECNFHTNGVCQTRACLIRGGYKVGEPVSFSLATCLPKEKVTALVDLQSRLTAAETRIKELERYLAKETKIHEGIEAMDQDIINNLRAELDNLKGKS